MLPLAQASTRVAGEPKLHRGFGDYSKSVSLPSGTSSPQHAAVAVQFVLNLVEPQSSGIGGGAFLLHWDEANLITLDGRETAPAAAKPERFLGPDGKPMAFYDAVVGGRSVGVPGTLPCWRRHTSAGASCPGRT